MACLMRGLGGDDGHQLAAGDEADVVELEDVEGVGDGHGEDVADLGDRDDAVVGRQVLREALEDVLADLDLGQVDGRDVHLLGDASR